MKKKLLKAIIIPLFFAITFVFCMPKVEAQYDPDNEYPLVYLGFDSTNTDLRNDPYDSDRSILVITVEFTSPLNAINHLTVTFDDVKDLGIGEPAIYFLSGMVDDAGMNTQLMTTMNINANGGIGDNLFYFNYPYSNATTYVMVYISIDKTLDGNYITNQQAIFDAIRFVPLAPYQYTKQLEQYTEGEILEMILLARYEGYVEGLAAVGEGSYESGQDDMYNNGSVLYGYDLDGSSDYIAGTVEGTSRNVNAGMTMFMAGFEKWIVPAIVIVILLGGFITIAAIKSRHRGD